MSIDLLKLATALLALPLAALTPEPATPALANRLAVRAGTIHTVEGEAIVGGGVVLIRDGKIVAV
jgi:hypothetical protein